jgi:MFS family permease
VAFYGATTATTTFMAASKHVAGYGLSLDVTALAYVGLVNTTAIMLGATAVPRLVKRMGHEPAVCAACGAMLAGYTGLAAWHGALWQVIAASSVSSFGMGLIASAMAVVLTERASAASTGISVGLHITVRAIGGSMAGAGFAALLTHATISGTIIPRESAYAAVWLTCALAALLSLLIVAAAKLKRSPKLSRNPP